MGVLTKRIGIDLGTSQTRIWAPRKGVVVDEPSVVARDRDNGKIVAVGFSALEMIGRTPESLSAFYPLHSGVIADFKAAEFMLRSFIQQAVGRFHISKPEAMITVSTTATSTERRAVVDVGKEAGLQFVHLIETPIAAALGAKLPITEPKGHMIIDIGSGTTEIAVISLGGVVAKTAIRTGGAQIDEALMRMMKHTHGIAIGKARAEEIKQRIGSISDHGTNKSMTVRGRSHVEGLPKSVTIEGKDTQAHIEPIFEKIRLAVRSVMEKTPPDLISDIATNGIMLTGGTSKLAGLESYLTHHLHTPCAAAEESLLCAVKGTSIALAHLKDYQRSLLKV